MIQTNYYLITNKKRFNFIVEARDAIEAFNVATSNTFKNDFKKNFDKVSIKIETISKKKFESLKGQAKLIDNESLIKDRKDIKYNKLKKKKGYIEFEIKEFRNEKSFDSTVVDKFFKKTEAAAIKYKLKHYPHNGYFSLFKKTKKGSETIETRITNEN